MAKTVVALFDDYGDAQAAVRALRADNRFDANDVSVLMHDHENQYSRDFVDLDGDDGTGHHGRHTKAGEGAAKGAGIGAAVGGLGGLLVGLGVLTLPGGALVAAGPLAAALIGAAGGAVAGGIIGALIGLGISEDDAHVYAEGVRRGGKLVLVRCADDRAEEAAEVLNHYRPVDIREREASWRAGGWQGRYTADPYRPDGDLGDAGGADGINRAPGLDPAVTYVRVYRTPNDYRGIEDPDHIPTSR